MAGREACIHVRIACAYAQGSDLRDNMIRKKAKLAIDAKERILRGLRNQPRQGITRYTLGYHIVIQGEQYVICRSRGVFRSGTSKMADFVIVLGG